jgi:hypothetical protein
MKRIFQLLAIAIAATPACAPEPPGPAVVGPDGGVVRSADGRLTMNVPRGALTADVRITIGRTETGDAVCYELGPGGTDFRVPVQVSYHAPVRSEWNILAISDEATARVCPRAI